MIELDCAINELNRLEVALEAADQAVISGNLDKTGYALDLIRLSLEDTRRRLKSALAEQRASTTVGKRLA